MQGRFLPIGSIVMLKGGSKEAMITSYCVISKEKGNTLYEYGGCTYPEGILDASVTLVFNHDQIDKIVFMGYETEDQKRYSEILDKNYDAVKEKFQKGELTKEELLGE